MDPQKITELAKLLRKNGDKILSSEFTLTLSGCLLRALNDSFTLITDGPAEIGASQIFQVAKPVNSRSPVFTDLQLIYDFVQKTTLLCIVHYPTEEFFEGVIDISKFRALRRLEVQKTNVQQIVGIQRLRAQLQHLICMKSLNSVEEIITRCGGDRSNGFVWNELKSADFSYNNLQRVDCALEFAQFLQHLNLRHNQLRSVEAIKWLPHLKTLDLSYNCLQSVPQFHLEAYKRLQSLNMSNNFVEDLMGIAKLDALTALDLCDNCLLDHSCLLPLSALLTLSYLNLYGNPLCCHPKHRLATAQFLHKNTATVKFILDFEPLSRREKSVTGSQQLRHVGALNRYAQKSCSTSIGNSRANSTSQTPASSVDSLCSFKLNESSTETTGAFKAAENGANVRKHTSKARTVDITEVEGTTSNIPDERDEPSSADYGKLIKVTIKNVDVPQPDTQHLETKKQIEALREKYGANWLQSTNAEMMQSVLGIEPTGDSLSVESITANTSRQLLDDFLGELSESALAATTTTKQTQGDVLQIPSNTFRSSTPVADSFLSSEVPKLEVIASPITDNNTPVTNGMKNRTLYKSIDSEHTEGNVTFYESAKDGDSILIQSSADSTSPVLKQPHQDTSDIEDNEPPHLKDVYSSAADYEPAVSEPEDDDETYIVYTTPRNEAVFLTISANYLRERDTLTQKTKTKWSLKILESCDRTKSNMLRINFDTIKADKKERIYTVEDGLCQELERKLRDILSQRDLTEMNQTVYRCVNCTCQFTVENKYKPREPDIHCPDCKSSFVAEIHDIPKPLTTAAAEKLSPAAIVEEYPTTTTTPLIVQRSNIPYVDVINATDTNSIGSANSLNDSSSCSKITNSQSSFESNQSVVGTSNAERDIEFNGESSDVDILSNPSQSSIEVLDRYASRKTSEERRISHMPLLKETIDDHSYTQSLIEQEFGGDTKAGTLENQVELDGVQQDERKSATNPATTIKTTTANSSLVSAQTSVAGALAHFQLTESSSSGSITDSVCTAYEQKQQQNFENSHSPDELLSKSAEQAILQNILAAERAVQRQHKQTPEQKESELLNGATSTMQTEKKEDSKVSSMFGALFQSTNMLMSSSKKLIVAEANAQSGTLLPGSQKQEIISACQPYKYNYTDFNDVDHRLKLYFYQTKFDEDEKFKWLARGRIYNVNTQSLCAGIIVMSTCKCYIMEAFAPENEDVTKWLRLLVSVTADRLECIQLLPWKMGLSFTLRDWGHFLLLLQDILRTDSLLLYFANNSLPATCELKYQPSTEILKRLNTAVSDEQLKMCALLNGCSVTCGQAKRTFTICTLLTTDTRLCISSGRFNWLTTTNPDAEIEVCLTQLMANLVEVEQADANTFTINYIDETQDQSEVWQCTFETKENAGSCLNAISQSWEQLFGVPLFNT